MTFTLAFTSFILFYNFIYPANDDLRKLGYRLVFLSLSLAAAALCFANYKDWV